MTDLTYAIGDVHGRLDLLERAFDAIMAHAKSRSVRVFLLGDYVDRGPQSKQVIDYLMRVEKEEPVTCLKGNHEAMFVEAFFQRERTTIKWWAGNGGDATIASYGGEYGYGKPSFWPSIPRGHIDWMSRLPTVAEHGKRLFVHAGFMPGTPLEQQSEEEVLWIRDKFLRAEADFKEWPYIVHGHTPAELRKQTHQALVLDWRCNLDSAAFHHGVLTVGVFEGEGGPPSQLIYVAVDGYETVPARIQD